MPTAIVIDSTASLPEAFPGDLPLTVVPAILNWNGTSYRDGLDITATAFYERLRIDPVHPTTSQVPPGSFGETFERLLAAGFDVLTLVVSSRISGTYQSAQIARDDLPGSNIVVLDSLSSGMGLGWAAITAARAAKGGADLDACRVIAEKALEHIGVVGTVNTLKYLHRSGRIGGASRFLGSALDLKPVLELRDGLIDGVDRVRTRRKAIARMLDLLEERIAGRSPVRLAVMHANDPDTADRLLELVSDRFEPVETAVSIFSPILGAAFGEGTVGVCYIAGIE